MRCSVAQWISLGWHHLHVESDGAYSIERLQQLEAYTKRTSSWRVAAVLLLTPVPSVLITLGMETIPLADPAQGVAHIFPFLARVFTYTLVASISVLDQCRHLIVRMPMSDFQLVASAILSSLGTSACIYLLACSIGYPVPFTAAVAGPIASSLLGACIFSVGKTFFYGQPQDLRDFWRHMIATGTQVAMLYVYTAYAYIFVRLQFVYQIAAALFAPLLKMLVKKWIAFVFRDRTDHKPEEVVFNAEIYHSLFISWSLQAGGNSIYTSLALLSIDFFEAIIAVQRTSYLRDGVDRIIERSGNQNAWMVSAFAHSFTVRNRNRGQSSQSTFGSLLTAALHIWSVHPLIYAKRVEIASSVQPRTAQSNIQVSPISSSQPVRRLVPGKSESLDKHPFHKSTNGAPLKDFQPTTIPRLQQICVGGETTQKRNEDLLTALVRTMPDEDRHLVLTKTLSLLHMTEYFVLVEYTEVIVSCVYCTWPPVCLL